MHKKPLTAEGLIGRRLASFTRSALSAIKRQFVVEVDDQGRITSARKKIPIGQVYRERALKKNFRAWVTKLPVLLHADPCGRHWSQKDLAFGRFPLGWCTYAEESTAIGDAIVAIYNFHGTLCDQAEGIRADEWRKLRRWMKAAGIRPLLWSREELEAAPTYGWGGYAIAKTPDGLFSICITARGGVHLSERQIYGSPYPVQLIGLLQPELGRLRRRMKEPGLKEVVWPVGNARTASALSASTVRVTRFAKGTRARADEALATQTYHHWVDQKGRHRISLPELRLEYEPMRSRGALELISRMKKDGLKPTAGSVSLDDYQGAES